MSLKQTNILSNKTSSRVSGRTEVSETVKAYKKNRGKFSKILEIL